MRQLEKQGTRSGSLMQAIPTPEPKPRGQDAPKGSADACLAVARMLQVSQFAAGETSMSPREPPMPATSEVTELDEL